MPPWVYLIPAVIIFSLGQVPAIIATIVYGVPPMLRLTTLAFKQVPKDLIELGQAIGAEVTRGLTRMEMGLGLRAGLAIVAVAILLDRLSRAALQRGRTTA